MLENQFIQFYGNITLAKMKPAIPIVIDGNHPLRLFINPPSNKEITAIEVVTMSDRFIDGEQIRGFDDPICTELFCQGALLGQVDALLSNGDRIMIRCELDQSGYMYSNPIVVFKEDDGFVEVSYRCEEDALGFPFVNCELYYAESKRAIISLPIRLHSPQNVQDDKTYVKANGEIVTLYAKYYKEWEGETEYLSEEMHDKIVAALSCDDVYIGGKHVTKSDKYQVDWDNYDLDCDGITKLAKATFKVREHITQRNSNY